MLKNVFTKIDILDFHASLQKGRGASDGNHRMVRSYGEAESDGAEGLFPSLLRGGLDNLVELPARKKEASALNSGRRTEGFSTETQQKETAAFMEADEVAENGAALSEKPLAADSVAVAAALVIAENSDDGRLTPFPVADQTLGETEKDDAGVEKGFSFDKVFDARWFAFGRENDFGEPAPNRGPLAHAVENQEAVTAPSACVSGLSLSASSVGVRDGKTARLPVDRTAGSLASNEPIQFAVNSKSEPAYVASGSFGDTPLAGAEEGDARTVAASSASAASVGVRDGKTPRLPVDRTTGSFAPHEPVQFAVDSKSEPAYVLSGSFGDTPLAGAEKSDTRTAAASFASASSVGVRDGKTARLPVDRTAGSFAPHEPIPFAVDSKSEPAYVASGSFRDIASPAMGEENTKRPAATFFSPDSETTEDIFTARDGDASNHPERMDSRQFSGKDTIADRRLYDFSRKQGEADAPFADEGSVAVRKDHEMEVKLSNSFARSPGREESASVVRDARDRQNAEMVNNFRTERVFSKGADETIPAVVYEGTAAAIDVSLQKKLDRESLLRDTENRFSFADFDAVENIRNTILKEAVSPSSKAQKEKSNLPGDEFSVRLPGNGAADIQATVGGRQVFSVDDFRSLESRTIAEQVMSQIPEDAFKSANRVRINLYPESLGKLDMEIVVRENRVHVFIMADRTDVVQALHGQQDQLKNALQSQGLQVSSLDFQWRENSSPLDDGSRSGDLWRHQNQDREQRQGHNEKDPAIAGNPGVLTGNVMRTQPLERTISVFV